jgi:hypothetical protein
VLVDVGVEVETLTPIVPVDSPALEVEILVDVEVPRSVEVSAPIVRVPPLVEVLVEILVEVLLDKAPVEVLVPVDSEVLLVVSTPVGVLIPVETEVFVVTAPAAAAPTSSNFGTPVPAVITTFSPLEASPADEFHTISPVNGSL